MDSVREFFIGIQSAVNVEATIFHRLRLIGPATYKSNNMHETIVEENGTLVKAQDVVSGKSDATLSIDSYAYFDKFGLFLTLANGAPVTTVGAALELGTFKHVWKRGVATPKLATCFFNDGISWRKSLNCDVQSMEVDQVAEKALRIKATMLAGFATEAVSGVPVTAYAYAAYNHPMRALQQTVNVLGSDPGATGRVLSTKWLMNNNRKSVFTTSTSPSPYKHEIGEAGFPTTVDLLALYEVYTGSLYEAEQTDALIGPVELVTQDLGTLIGSDVGTVTHPKMSLLLPRAKATDADRQPKASVEQSVKMIGLYDATTAAGAVFTLWNEVAAAVYAGTV